MKDGEYKFNPKQLGFAHQFCQNRCSEAMVLGKDVIVSNTSTTEKEVKTYTDFAEKYDYKVVSLIVENRHSGTNVHNVPEEALIKMKDRFTIKL